MKHPSTKPTVCRTDKQLRLNPIYHASCWLLWQRWSCRPLQPPSLFPAVADAGSSQALAGSGAGSIHPAARAGERCWLFPLCHLTDQRPPVTHRYLPSCSVMGLQGQNPDTATALKPPALKSPAWGTEDPGLHFEPAPREPGEIGARRGAKDMAHPWPAAWITQNLSGCISVPRRINI